MKPPLLFLVSRDLTQILLPPITSFDTLNMAATSSEPEFTYLLNVGSICPINFTNFCEEQRETMK